MYKNKTILITGASSGLGKNIAINYAKQGGRIINLSRSEDKMKMLNIKLDKLNNLSNLYFSTDVSKYDSIKSIKNQL